MPYLSTKSEIYLEYIIIDYKSYEEFFALKILRLELHGAMCDMSGKHVTGGRNNRLPP